MYDHFHVVAFGDVLKMAPEFVVVVVCFLCTVYGKQVVDIGNVRENMQAVRKADTENERERMWGRETDREK